LVTGPFHFDHFIASLRGPEAYQVRKARAVGSHVLHEADEALFHMRSRDALERLFKQFAGQHAPMNEGRLQAGLLGKGRADCVRVIAVIEQREAAVDGIAACDVEGGRMQAPLFALSGWDALVNDPALA
jgi:hypothetical protein